MIGRGEVGREGGGGEMKIIMSLYLTRFFFYLLQLVIRGFCTENIIKKEWSSTDQASNETLPKKNSWRYLFANRDRHIYIYIYIYI